MELHDNYKVELSNIFSGPMDLLLYLVKKEEVAIYEISIARITCQYMQHLELLQLLDVNLSSEFLVIAATLMQIKSRSLLPVSENIEEDEEDDPKFELIKHLLEYKKYKDMSLKLEDKGDEIGKRFSRPKINLNKNYNNDLEFELTDIGVWDLYEKFFNLMKQTLSEKLSIIKDDDKSVAEYMKELITRVNNETNIYFDDLFTGLNNKWMMLGFFLALLELARLKKIRFEQDISFERIKICKKDDQAAQGGSTPVFN